MTEAQPTVRCCRDGHRWLEPGNVHLRGLQQPLGCHGEMVQRAQDTPVDLAASRRGRALDSDVGSVIWSAAMLGAAFEPQRDTATTQRHRNPSLPNAHAR